MHLNHENGFIEWEVGTGGNHEITQIKVYLPRKGIGKELVKMYTLMCDPPYFSVYAFALGTRDGARKFYESFGMREINIGRSIYRDDDTILFWIPFKELKEKLYL